MVARLVLYLRMIKFSHSVFALPFAFTAMVLAADGIPRAGQILWIAVAMVSGRTAAMGLNRIIDRRIDAENPRTAGREIPSGKIKVTEAMVFVLISLIVFFFAAYMLNPLCLRLAPIAVFFFILYPYTKRFTWLSHVVLGIAISGAPLGAWIAIRGSIDVDILPLCIAVVFWLAGFDVLYALQDLDFDQSKGLYSIPARFGVKRALFLSRGFHLITWSLLLVTALVFRLGALYYIGLLLVATLLVHEHRLVKEDDLSKLNMAFFNMNGYISIAVFLFTTLDIFMK
ncbi:MAG TPA: DoxX family membrane protein [Nitrospirae bacterium]|nr:DoxX family membrane protein [Nitrospirota bacterium]